LRRCCLGLAALFATLCRAAPLEAGIEGAGTTSADFLKIGSGARPAALGQAYVGLADDAAGLAYNPAGMSRMDEGEISLTHTEWFQGLRLENLDAAASLGQGMLGASLDFLSIPALQGTQQIADTSDPSQNYQNDGSFSPYDLAFGLAYSQALLQGLLGGLRVQLVNEAIDSTSLQSLSLDLGLLALSPVKNLDLGLSVQNLGAAIGAPSGLPEIARLGAAYRAGEGRLLLLAEADLPSDAAPVLAMGLEYDFNERFFPRVGYRVDGVFNPWSAGLGAHFDPIRLDLSLVPFGELGLTYRASLSYSFGQLSAAISAPLNVLSSQAGARAAQIEPRLGAAGKVTAWGLFIYDSSHPPRMVRHFQGQGPLRGPILWDGKFDDGSPAPEGAYWAVLSARYGAGKTLNTPYLRLEVSNSPAQGELKLDPVSVNPDAAGEGFVPTQFSVALRGRKPLHWRLEILDSQGKVFRAISGDAEPPAQGLFWDGKGDKGDELVSGQVYQARLILDDPLLGEAATAAPLSFRAVFR
jgi:hypothetical protein